MSYNHPLMQWWANPANYHNYVYVNSPNSGTLPAQTQISSVNDAVNIAPQLVQPQTIQQNSISSLFSNPIVLIGGLLLLMVALKKH